MQSIGERLEEARKRKGVTIREAAEVTKIRGEYLNNFESNNFTINVPDIYVRGFLRSYSNFLKVNADKVLTDYNATLIGEAKAAKRDNREFFGRMELQQPLVTDASGGSIDNEPLNQSDDDDENSGSFLSRIDKEVAIKVGIMAVVAILLILSLVWLFSKVTGGSEIPGTPAPAAATSMVPADTAPTVEIETIRLFATGDVRVSVTERNTGKVLLDLHPMSDGQSVEISKQGSVKIDYTAGENLEVEVKGKRYQTGKTGESFSTIP